MGKKILYGVLVLILLVGLFFVGKNLGLFQTGLAPNEAYVCDYMSLECVPTQEVVISSNTTKRGESKWLYCDSDKSTFNGNCAYFVEKANKQIGGAVNVNNIEGYACVSEYDTIRNPLPYTLTTIPLTFSSVKTIKSGCAKISFPLGQGTLFHDAVPQNSAFINIDIINDDTGLIDTSGKQTKIFIENTELPVIGADHKITERGMKYVLRTETASGLVTSVQSCDLNDLDSEDIYPAQPSLIPMQTARNFESVVAVGKANNYCERMTPIRMDLNNNVILKDGKYYLVEYVGWKTPLKEIIFNGERIRYFASEDKIRDASIACYPSGYTFCNPDATLKPIGERTTIPKTGDSCSMLNPPEPTLQPISQTEACRSVCSNGNIIRQCEQIIAPQCQTEGLGYDVATNKCVTVTPSITVPQNTQCPPKVLFNNPIGEDITIPDIGCKLKASGIMGIIVTFIFGLIGFMLLIFFLLGAFKLIGLNSGVITLTIILISVVGGLIFALLSKTYFYEILILYVATFVGIIIFNFIDSGSLTRRGHIKVRGKK